MWTSNRTPLDFSWEKIDLFEAIKKAGVIQILKYFGNEVLKVLSFR